MNICIKILSVIFEKYGKQERGCKEQKLRYWRTETTFLFSELQQALNF